MFLKKKKTNGSDSEQVFSPYNAETQKKKQEKEKRIPTKNVKKKPAIKREEDEPPYQIPIVTKKDLRKRQMLDVVLFFLPIVILFVVLKCFFLVGVVPSTSMYPLMNSDSGIVGNRLAYKLSAPRRGDVIVFRKGTSLMTKRIVGIPGDKVAIQHGILYINEQPIVEDYVPDTVDTEPLNGINYFEVPENEYFVLGDNRINSNDSRQWDDPYVPQKNIIAKVMCVFSINPMSHGFYYRGVNAINMDLVYSGAPKYDANDIVTETTSAMMGGTVDVEEVSPMETAISYTLPVATIETESVTAATEEVSEESGEGEEEGSGEDTGTDESSTDSLEGQVYEESSAQ